MASPVMYSLDDFRCFVRECELRLYKHTLRCQGLSEQEIAGLAESWQWNPGPLGELGSEAAGIPHRILEILPAEKAAEYWAGFAKRNSQSNICLPQASEPAPESENVPGEALS